MRYETFRAWVHVWAGRCTQCVSPLVPLDTSRWYCRRCLQKMRPKLERGLDRIRERQREANLREVCRIVQEREVEAELQGDRDSLFADREFVERWIGAKCGDR